ncbi:EamA family transporter [Sulfitobacter sp. SK012]|uniref:DMT family transporter n=1 Tax=Sulfitobacter sp. SK012 TaxID=1389005 RepID=UPI000E0C5218|nr:DMT family transporter [Sulfitobacter sp. SK012]AXI48739.1 EamA family transporter [Sulfitobacter sp. SK012]
MRIAFLTTLTMFAFAANSLLTRAAVDGGHMDPAGFAVLRVLSGAVVLASILAMRGGGVPLLRRERLPGAISLAVYMMAFSLAYLTLDAGLGALILFGVVQISMFSYAALLGETPTPRQIVGAVIAFLGLLLALWPGPGGLADPVGAGLMVAAGVGWAIYTIVGRRASDPLAATGANFILCLPMVALLLGLVDFSATVQGVALAVLCGGVTSGLGYALWYSILPKITGATAAIVQLSVPVIAILAGAVFLGEELPLIVIVSATLVVGGIAWGVTAPRVQRTKGSRGS